MAGDASPGDGAPPASPAQTTDAAPDTASVPTAGTAPGKAGFWALAIGAIGVVFGDIGTSPLYAMREALAHAQRASAASWPCSASSRWCSGP